MIAWLTVIGIGEDGFDALDPAARAALAAAEILVGGARHLAMLPERAAPGRRMVWDRPFEATIDAILAGRGRAVAVLASGDPMEYGVGATLSRQVPTDEMIVLPRAGAFSLAAARLCWPLQTLRRITLHGRPIENLASHLAPGARLLCLSDDGSTPRLAAAWLGARGWGASRMTVLEHLGGARERIVAGRATELAGADFAPLNILAIECVASASARPLSRLAGLPDDAFRHDGQLTKRVVRAATLALLAPLPGELLWDVGAGCGSIAIEWLRADAQMRAIAIESSADRCGLIGENALELGAPDLRIVLGTAPDHLDGLPCPDAVFIGGGLEDAVFDRCWAALRPGGRLVANAVTLEGEAVLNRAGRLHGGTLGRIACSTAEPLGSHRAWRPARPVTQLFVRKPA